jgi:hypothetical protein
MNNPCIPVNVSLNLEALAVLIEEKCRLTRPLISLGAGPNCALSKSRQGHEHGEEQGEEWRFDFHCNCCLGYRDVEYRAKWGGAEAPSFLLMFDQLKSVFGSEYLLMGKT